MQEKQEILDALAGMAATKKRKSEEEKALLDQFTSWLGKSSFTTRSVGKIRNLFKRTLFTGAREKDLDLEKYFKRKVFKKIELKAARQGRKITLPEDEMYYLCLLGTLLASVAQVDGHFDESEKKALQQVLQEKFSFDKKEMKILFEVVEEQAKHGFDFHEVITQTNQIVTYNERLKLIDCFFAIATADGEISHAESEQIRKITKAMHISHHLFKEAKIKALEALRGE